ncbi:PAS domain-containing protein [bacterium]|nr:PAS domain-containing protein [bacterium]
MNSSIRLSYEELEKRLAEAERILDSFDPSGMGGWRTWLPWIADSQAGARSILEELERRVQKRTVDLVKANEALHEEIAERRKTESALRESELRFRSLFENSPIAIVQLDLSRTQRYFRAFLDKDTAELVKSLSVDRNYAQRLFRSIRVVNANRACLRLHDSESLESYRNFFQSTFASETVMSLIRVLKHLQAGKELIKEETVILTLTGQRREVLIEVYATPGDGDKWSRVVLHYIDLTELKRTERNLRRNEAQLAEAQRIANLGSWEWELASDRVKWSDTLYEIFGVSRDTEITDALFMQMVHPDDRERMNAVVQDALKHGQRFSLDYRIVPPGGGEKTIHETGELRCDKAGKAVRVVGTAQDITRLKQIQQNLIEERGKLRVMLKYQGLQAEVAAWLNSQNSIQDIIGLLLEKICKRLDLQTACFFRVEDTSPSGMCLHKSYNTDPQRHLCHSEKAIQNARYLLRQLRIKGLLRLSGSRPSESRRLERYFGARNCSLLCCPLTLRGEVKGFILFWRGAPQEWDRNEEEVLGTLSGMIAGAWEREHHLQARLEAERKQTQAVRMAEQAVRMASIGVLAGGVTHEINQPLNAMNLVTESLIADVEGGLDLKPWQLLEHLRTMSGQIQRISDIISHMRNFWVAPQHSDNQPFDLDAAVDYALALVRSQLNSHGVRLERISENPGLNLTGNRIHLEQITLNLVVNAMQAHDRGRPGDKYIRVRSARQNGRALLEVEDNGPGFPEADVDKLFDPFYSTRKPGEGTGLGLAIVRKFVDEFGGAISAALNASGGATFRMEFPVQPATTES